MRLLLLLWAMLAALGVALSGASAAARQVETSISVADAAALPAAVRTVRPAAQGIPRIPLTIGAVRPASPSAVPLYAERRRE